MNENTVLIRKAEEKDYPFILRVNEENVEVLSPMDEAKLKGFAEFAELLLVAEVDNAPAAFLIGIREGIGCYDSENYLWFQKKYPQFLYVDRIVIDEPYRSAGIGKMLYQEVLHYACLTGVPMVTAEIDTIPYNETSLKFHERMGFQEVGVQFVRNNSIKVSTVTGMNMLMYTTRNMIMPTELVMIMSTALVMGTPIPMPRLCPTVWPRQSDTWKR